MTQSIPLMFIPLGISRRISKRLVGIGSLFAGFFPGMRYDLEKTDLDLSAGEYMAACLANCFFIFIIFSAVLSFIFYFVREKTLEYSVIFGSILGVSLSSLFLLLLVRYPVIIAKKKSEQLEKNLVFALKDMLLQISSGISLYNTLVNVSVSDYGLVSREFGKAVRQVNSGKPMDRALEDLAVTSESEYLRKAVWQIVNTLRAGSSLKGALSTIINNLSIEQKAKIRGYAKELNMWSLMYMLFAVAVPTLGITFMVILSSFAGVGVSKALFILFIVICFIVQYVMIGLIKTRRPVVHI